MSKIQNENVKSESEIISDGGIKAQLVNDTKIYVTANSINKRLDEAITDGDIGGGGNGDGFNYIQDSSAEQGLGDWVVYKNTDPTHTIGTIPAPDDFGGTISGNLTYTVNTTDPLIESADFKLSKTASNVQGEGVYYPFTGERAHLALKLLFRVFADLSDLSDNDIRLWLVSSSDSFVSDFNVITASNPQALVSKVLIKQFQLDATDRDYRLCIHYGSTDTVAKDAFFDGFFFGPRTTAKGAIITEWADFPSVAAGTLITGASGNPVFGTTTVNKAIYRRVAGNAEIIWQFNQTTAAPDGGIGTYFFNLPSFLKIDSEYVTTNSLITSVGTFSSRLGGLFDHGEGWVYPVDETRLAAYYQFQREGAPTTSGAGLWGSSFGNLATPPGTFTITIRASIPIKGWSAETTMSEDFSGRIIALDAFLTSGSHAGGGDELVNFNVIARDSVNAFNGTTYTIKESGDYQVNSHLLATSGAFNNVNIRVTYAAGGNRFFDISGTSTVADGNITTFLNVGDVVEVVVNATVATAYQTIGNGCHISIFKVSSPQTILETEAVAARYTSNSGQSIPFATYTTVVYEDIDFDTHGSYNNTSGVYTAPVSGYFKVDASIWITLSAGNGSGVLSIFKNASQYNEGDASVTISNELSQAHSALVQLNKGDTLEIKLFHTSPDGLSKTLQTNSLRNYFSIARIK